MRRSLELLDCATSQPFAFPHLASPAVSLFMPQGHRANPESEVVTGSSHMATRGIAILPCGRMLHKGGAIMAPPLERGVGASNE
jgi:hypothetical protein